MKGIISQWHDNKGYGFIKPDHSPQQQYFFHVSDVDGSRHAIALNAQVSFELDASNEKVAAKNVRLINSTLAVRAFYQMAIYGGLPLLALSSWYWIEPLIFGGYLLMSLLTFIAYWFDKSKAESGLWRTPEYKLHLMELLGGWPGALAAQRVFRHKIRKISYQLMLWLIISVHLGAAVDTFIFGGHYTIALLKFFPLS